MSKRFILILGLATLFTLTLLVVGAVAPKATNPYAKTPYVSALSNLAFAQWRIAIQAQPVEQQLLRATEQQPVRRQLQLPLLRCGPKRLPLGDQGQQRR